MALMLGMVSILLAACDRFQLDAQPPTRDIHYADHDETTLDVYLPETGNVPYPTVLLVHGRGVSKDYFQGTSTIEDLNQQGYAAVSINYQFPTATDPGISLAHVACALAWVHNQGDAYNLDTENIVVFGHSTGATLAALLAARDDISTFLEDCPGSLPENQLIRGVIGYGGRYGIPSVSFSDPAFLDTFGEHSEVEAKMIREMFDQLSQIPPSEWVIREELPELVRWYASFFPIAWIDGTEPPFLLVHGEIDGTVTVNESIAFADVLRQAGVQVELEIIPSDHHRVNQRALHEPLFAFLSGLAAQQR